MTLFLLAESLTHVHTYIKLWIHSTTCRRMKLKLSEHCDDILALYDSGMSMTDIARRYDCYLQNVSNLIKKHRVVPSKAGTINSTYFSNIDSHLKAYFVGFIAGDGAFVKASRSSSVTLTISLNERDTCVLEKLHAELGMSRPLWRFTSQGKFPHIRLVTSDRQIVSDLMSLGLGFKKSLTLPNIIPNIPEEFRNSFILGLFDADGSCCVREAEWFDKARGKTYSGIRHAIQIRATMPLCVGIVNQLGISSFHISNADSIPNLVIGSRSEFTKFFNLVYADCPFYLQRKYDKFLSVVRQDQTISSSAENDNVTAELGARVAVIA